MREMTKDEERGKRSWKEEREYERGKRKEA